MRRILDLNEQARKRLRAQYITFRLDRSVWRSCSSFRCASAVVLVVLSFGKLHFKIRCRYPPGPRGSSVEMAAAAGWTLRWLYLSAYNVVLFIGWTQILYLAIDALSKGGPSSVYAAVEKPLQIWQTAALFEIFNSIVGIVRSPVSATLPQISSRLYVTWGILYSFPETREHWLVTSLILSWAITEVIRYFFFALKEAFGVTPPLLTVIRYSTFFVLYPTGILSEAGLIYVALPFMKVSERYCLRMPNIINFGFDYYSAAIVILGLYVPGGPFMYTHMIGQRKKALEKQKKQ